MAVPQMFHIDCKPTGRKVQVAEVRHQFGFIGSSQQHRQVDRECQHTHECRSKGIDCMFAFGSRDPRH